MTNKHRKKIEELRSQRWYAGDTQRSMAHRTRSRQLGFSMADIEGRPVIGIINTWSDMNTCHGHFKDRAASIKRGVWQAGGFAVELPAMSVGEILVKPTTMLYRNFLAMEAEELVLCHPIDGVVLMGGCDKTTPALLMAACSLDLPAIYMPAGPMLRGYYRGETLGSGTDIWKYWADKRAGLIDQETMEEVGGGLARSAGTCMTMGTASTMTSLADTLGFTLPGASSIPAVDSNHALMAAACGRRIVEMVWEDLKPSDILSAESFDNAVIVDMALGGSTNAAIHLIAMAGRAGVDLDLPRFDALSRTTPVIANIRPSGEFLMEDFYYAGGLGGLLNRLAPLLNRDCPTVSGLTIGEISAQGEVLDDRVILALDKPLSTEGGTAILYGNLAPDGCVVKQTAADPRLHRHTGPAVVFKDYNDLAARIDDPALEVTPDSVLVLQNCGPVGGPGMPEWGMLPIPKKILAQGVRDMVRISDARMSGTSYGTCILHVSPEAHIGGPLALLRDGDMIALDVPGRSLNVELSDDELAARKALWRPRQAPFVRGYGAMYAAHVSQAHKGCDFDFLSLNAPRQEPEIH